MKKRFCSLLEDLRPGRFPPRLSQSIAFWADKFTTELNDAAGALHYDSSQGMATARPHIHLQRGVCKAIFLPSRLKNKGSKWRQARP